MEKKEIVINNEIQLLAFQKKLEDAGIQYHVRNNNPSALPYLHDQVPSFVVTVELEEGQELPEVPSTAGLVDRPSSTRKLPWGKVIWIVYTLGVTIALYIFVFYSPYSSLSEDKHFRYEWSNDGTSLKMIDKKRNKIIQNQMDENWNQNFEVLQNFDVLGKIISLHMDANEDGYYEQVTYYDFKGVKRGWAYDKNGDNVMEHITELMENGDTLIMTDSNENGQYEYQIKPFRNK